MLMWDVDRGIITGVSPRSQYARDGLLSVRERLTRRHPGDLALHQLPGRTTEFASLMTVPDSPDAFAPVATEFLQLVEGERITVYQHMFEEEELEPWYCSDISAVPQYVPVACDSVPGYVTQERRAVNIRDIHDMESVGATFPGLQCDYSYELETEEYTRSVMAVPIRSRDRVVGAIEVVNCRRAESHSTFTAEDMVALQELAGLMAPVFDTQESELLLPDPGAGSLFGGPFQELVERGLVTE